MSGSGATAPRHLGVASGPWLLCLLCLKQRQPSLAKRNLKGAQPVSHAREVQYAFSLMKKLSFQVLAAIIMISSGAPALAHHCDEAYQEASECTFKNSKFECREELKRLRVCLGNSGHYHYKPNGERVCIAGIC